MPYIPDDELELQLTYITNAISDIDTALEEIDTARTTVYNSIQDINSALEILNSLKPS